MKEDKIMRVGIVGAGWIAEKAAITLNGLENCECYAIGSRSKAKADEFARKWNMPKAYGSYTELIADQDVDLVYIATPHSHHYEVTKQALLADKPSLVEKAFMANLREAKEVVALARQRGVFLAEAVWTRYQPVVETVRQLISSGRIGNPRLVTATLGYSMGNKPRIMLPELCGGVLLPTAHTEHRLQLRQVGYRHGYHQCHDPDSGQCSWRQVAMQPAVECCLRRR